MTLRNYMQKMVRAGSELMILQPAPHGMCAIHSSSSTKTEVNFNGGHTFLVKKNLELHHLGSVQVTSLYKTRPQCPCQTDKPQYSCGFEQTIAQKNCFQSVSHYSSILQISNSGFINIFIKSFCNYKHNFCGNRSSLKKMATVSEYDLSCPICCRVFRDPVLLSCTHSFCRECVKTWWEQKPLRPCPICKRRSSREDPPLNLALTNLCLDFEESSIESCSEHSERLKLYCYNHQQPICLVCRDSEAHRGHIFKPIAEVTPGFKKWLQNTLQPLNKHLQALDKSKLQFSAAAAHVEAQARLTEKQIQDQFKKLHQFLEEEEQTRLRALREEEQQKRRRLEDKVAAVSREIEALAETIAATEKQMEAADASFLLQYKAAVKRVQRCPLVEVPQMEPGALIDQAKHLGNLSFNVWRNMKDLVQFYPVVLDPNTAHPDLTMTKNLASVKFGERQKFPENPERFQWDWVLGSEGFSSGTHSWEVEVSGEDSWSVGVVSESVQRKGPMNTGVWEIYFMDGQYHTISRPKRDKTLSLQKNLQRVQVKLDFDKGTLSFSDADTNTHLHTFSHSFSERMFPCFRTINNEPLQIIPLNISIKLN